MTEHKLKVTDLERRAIAFCREKEVLFPIANYLVEFAEEVTKELQEENEQLKKDLVENKSDCENCYKSADEKIKVLEEMIEKMKCCNNCKHRYFMDFKSVCAFDKSDIKDIENPTTCKCNKWEIEG